MKSHMKIRTLLNLSLLITLAGFLACGIWLNQSLEERNRISEIYEYSHTTAQEGARLLQLTYALGVDPSASVIEQWLLVHKELSECMGSLSPLMTNRKDLAFMQERANDIKELFENLLINSEGYSRQLLDKRSNILMDRMVTEAHQITESAYRIAVELKSQQETHNEMLIKAFLLAMAALLFCVLTFGMLMRQRVLKPLLAIESTAREIRNGNLSARVQTIRGGDEIGNLASLLNVLAQGLESRIETLSKLNDTVSREAQEREKSEERLALALSEIRTSTNLLESAGRISGVGGWILDLETKELNWSQQMHVIVQAPPDYNPDLQTVLAMFPGEARDKLSKWIELAASEGNDIDVELPFVTMKGQSIWVQVYGEVHFEERDDKFVPVKLIGAFQDISQRKEIQLALEKATKDAETASRAKGEFLANMSHEIRTPLNAIIGLAYILRGTNLNFEQLDLISKLEGAGKSLIELISDILDLSKIDAGKIEFEKQEFTIYELFDSLSSIAAGYKVKQGVDVVFCPSANVPAAIIGDGTKIKQVLVNLLGNALKFTEKGYVRVSCDLIELTDYDCILEFSVEDSGIGMDPDALSKLFNSFSQGDSSISRRYGGTGIGLALSQKLVNRMGGKIAAESRTGLGSRFSFQLGFPTVNSEFPHDDSLSDVELVFANIPGTLRQSLVQFALRFDLRFTQINDGTIDQVSEHLADCEIRNKRVVTLLCENSELAQHTDQLQKQDPISARKIQSCIKMCQTHMGSMVDPDQPGEEFIYLRMPITPSAFLMGIKSALQSKATGDQKSRQTKAEDTRVLDGLKLLAVDDSQLNLKILKKILTNCGADVYTAEDGHQAIEVLRAHADEIDLCLMDVQMPNMDGLEACIHMRQVMGMTELPILALTAGAMLAEHQNAMDAGMNAVLTKPLDVDKVVQAIRYWATKRALQT